MYKNCNEKIPAFDQKNSTNKLKSYYQFEVVMKKYKSKRDGKEKRSQKKERVAKEGSAKEIFEESLVRYGRSYKFEIIDSKDPLARLEASKSSIEDLFQNLLNEMKGFKYQITVTVLLFKHKENVDIEYAPVYFNSATKTVINSDKYELGKSFQEILYRQLD